MKTQNDAQPSTGSACPKKAHTPDLINQPGMATMSDATTALTFDRLPNLSPRPENAADHTGKRRGRMTAIAWCRPSRSGKGTVWVCRCDCGLFEYRRPGTWASKPFPEDRCRTCLHTGPNASDTAPVRLQRWVDGLRRLGLTEAEIVRVQALGTKVETRDKTATQIRAQIS
ncbi:hypothetical protein [Pseudomonas sp. Leaf127]|uniref:hypothetical protein n=1 Tax=Pseudomonas sp. Leaf127 TaxID=1736267 RepID=UPI0012E92DCB|nr:hypothetical protein [Pseudomonas sp. Leaf127]